MYNPPFFKEHSDIKHQRYHKSILDAAVEKMKRKQKKLEMKRGGQLLSSIGITNGASADN